MFRCLRRVLLMVFDRSLIGSAYIPFLPLEEQTLSIMDSTDKQVTEKFAAFEKEQDPVLVHEALDLIETAERDMPAGDTAARKQALSRRLRFFAALDRNIDPMWDPKDKPVMGVSPPLSHGVVYSSGEVDPATIPDPEVRAQYVQALKANKDDYQRYSVQSQLRRIDERAMRFMELLAERFVASPVDRQEFEKLLAASTVSDARKERLRALLPGSHQNEIGKP
jgi:hypothetical protein